MRQMREMRWVYDRVITWVDDIIKQNNFPFKIGY